MTSTTISNPSFETLYKKNNKGKVTVWSVWMEPAANNAYEVVCEYGEQDGKKIQHRKQISEGKAKRTVMEQAFLEARSKWNEKHDREGYRPSVILDVSNHVFIAPTAPLRPMLANTYESAKVTASTTKGRAYRMPFPCFLQRKLDGIRCIAKLGAENHVVMESRKGTEFMYFDHIRSTILHLFDHLFLPRDLHLDGELYSDSLPFEIISGVVRQKKENKKTNEQDRVHMRQIKYYVYDVYLPSRPEATFQERLEILQTIQTACQANGDVQIVQTEQAREQADIKKKHDEYVAEGFEGIMLRDPIGIYEPNKRSKYLQKYKEFMEEEFRIVGFHDGEGIDQGLVIWECALGSPEGGKTFSVKPKGSHEARRLAFETAQDQIGKLLTVIFQEYSSDGVPRFPVGKAIRIDL